MITFIKGLIPGLSSTTLTSCRAGCVESYITGFASIQDTVSTPTTNFKNRVPALSLGALAVERAIFVDSRIAVLSIIIYSSISTSETSVELSIKYIVIRAMAALITVFMEAEVACLCIFELSVSTKAARQQMGVPNLRLRALAVSRTCLVLS